MKLPKKGEYEIDTKTNTYIVGLETGFYFDCEKHIEAEILSRLVKIEQMLKKKH